jgi:hypothetical protein
MYGRVVPRKYVTPTTVIIAIGVLAFAGVITAILLSSHPSDDHAPTTAQIEVRSNHRAQILFGGKSIGLAPRMLVVPMSTTPIDIAADYGHGRVITRSVVPDHNQLVDFQ